jgi:hypothetical protein
MDTFQREITFVSKVSQPSGDGKTIDWVITPQTKTANFKELNQLDKTQHKLHFKIISVAESFGQDEEGKMNISSDGIYDLTVKCINNLLVIDENFTAADKQDFLSDSGAILPFGMWMLTEKLMPFFLKLNLK